MSVYRFFWHFGPHFGVLVALGKTLWCLFSTSGVTLGLGLRLVILGAPVWHPWVHFVTLGIQLKGFLWIWGDLGAPL